MKVIFRAGSRIEEVDYPDLNKEEIYQEFIEWLLEVADASCEYEDDEYCDEIPGISDGSMGKSHATYPSFE